MADFIIVESNHAWMRYSQEVARQTIAFLRSGRFLRKGGEAAAVKRDALDIPTSLPTGRQLESHS
jgi:hypothetical protein